MLLIFLFFAFSSFALSPQECLKGKITIRDKRYKTFEKALSLMEERHARAIVETGTARNGNRNCVGDGCSTLIFSRWAERDQGALFFSVDIDPGAVSCSRHFTKQYRNTFVECMDSVSFLEHFGKMIDFLYLDSYDFDEKNPLPSQTHHLREIEAAYPWLSEQAIVMIDDCALPYGGKGKLAIEFLLQREWKIVQEEYQVILVRKSTE